MMEDETPYWKVKVHVKSKKKVTTTSTQNSVYKCASKLKLSGHLSEDQYNKIVRGETFHRRAGASREEVTFMKKFSNKITMKRITLQSSISPEEEGIGLFEG